jgi:lactate 2-monooxygenase
MAHPNVDLVLRFRHALDVGDEHALASLLAAECELWVPELLPYGGRYTGLEGFLGYREAAARVHSTARNNIYEVHPTADAVCDIGALAGRTRVGVDFIAPFAHVTKVSDGHIAAVHSYIAQARIMHALEGRQTPPTPFREPRAIPGVNGGGPPAADDDGASLLENLALARRVCTLLMQPEDIDTVRQFVAPGAALYVPSELPYGGVYTGPEGFLQYCVSSLAACCAAPGVAHADYLEFHGAGNVVFVEGVLHAVARTEAEFTAPLAAVFTIDEGKIIRALVYLDAARILLALDGRWWIPASRLPYPRPALSVTSARSDAIAPGPAPTTKIPGYPAVSGVRSWPRGPAEWESRASQVLPSDFFDYIAGVEGVRRNIRASCESFERWRLRPHMLTANVERDLSVNVLGTQLPAPFLLAPIGILELAHRDGERIVAQAGAAAEIPFIVSSVCSNSLEVIASTMESAARWFQLYWVNDRAVVSSLLGRAEQAGYSAVVVTLDTLHSSGTSRVRKVYPSFSDGQGIGHFISDPAFRRRLGNPPEDDLAAAGTALAEIFAHPELTWRDLDWLRAETRLPVLVKGILNPEDAVRAREHGADGVIVSNHGGYALDSAIAPLDVLPNVRAALGNDATILMDGGVRSGTDIVKALALGANATLVGRPYLFGLAVGGADGVTHVLDGLRNQLDSTLALMGGRSVVEIDSSYLVHHR